MYIIKMMDNTKFRVSRETYQKLSGKEGLVFIPELNVTINLSSVSSIYPVSDKKKVEGGGQVEGFLHDGTRVIKKFGEWVIAGEETPDDKGNSQPVKLDKQYYPEVAADCVATTEEYQEILEGKDYYEVVGYNPRKNKELNKGEFTHILDK